MPQEEPILYHDIEIDSNIAYLLGITRRLSQTPYLARFSTRARKFSQANKIIKKISGQLRSTLEFRQRNIRYFDSQKLWELSKEIGFERSNDRKLYSTPTTFNVPIFLRNNGYDVIQAFFMSILASCSGPKQISIDLEEKDLRARTFIKDLAWISGHRIKSAYFSTYYKNWSIKINRDNITDLKDRRDNYTTLTGIWTSKGNTFVLPVPVNWDPIIDGLAVRRHKINYKEG